LADTYDIVVAGGGIAGLTAGLHAARLGRRTLVLTGGAPGGLLLSIETIEGLPGFPEGAPGYDFCPALQEQAAQAGAEFSFAELTGLEQREEAWQLATPEGKLAARAVVVATGAQLKELGVPGEERLRGKGVSHCATCDAPLLRGRHVAVVGGGDSALQESLTLAGSVERVTILHRGPELSAQATYRERVLGNPKIEVRTGTLVEEILGDGAVAAVRTRDVASGETGQLDAGGVFVYIGLRPSSELLAGRLELDATGHVPVDAWMRTELPGLFAAGIVRSDSSGQAAGAAGDGTAAAFAAHRYLTDGVWPEQALARAAASALPNGGSDG
jgi:thioredoxin reductase (NADPH)